jgi:solute carrier family 50 (sugar transporter)
MLVTNPVVVSTLKVAGPLFFLGLQGSSVKTAFEIIQNKSVGGLSMLPFASLLTNCIIWSLYGILKKDSTVLYPNALGILSGTFCVGSYKRYSTKSDLSTIIGAFLIIAFSTSLYYGKRVESLGTLGCAIAVLLMGSPLATFSTVIKEKSTNSMPFLSSLTTWCNAFSWSMYGLLVAGDIMIYGPNLVGLVLASFQMLLFAIYGLPNKSAKSSSNGSSSHPSVPKVSSFSAP